MDLRRKHALVTGAGKRLGRAMAEELLKQGMNLSAHFFNSHKEIEELIEWAKINNYGQVVPIQADLTHPEELSYLHITSHKELGPVDLLINSASHFFPSPLPNTTVADWDSLFDLNLKAPFFLTQLCASSMPQGSQVIFIADVHATQALKNYGPYCASKAGLISLCKSLAKELAPEIRVNCISPGTLLPPDNATPDQIQRARERSLLKRVGTPNDLVKGLMFLLKNPYITGFDLVIDGGRSLTHQFTSK